MSTPPQEDPDVFKLLFPANDVVTLHVMTMTRLTTYRAIEALVKHSLLLMQLSSMRAPDSTTVGKNYAEHTHAAGELLRVLSEAQRDTEKSFPRVPVDIEAVTIMVLLEVARQKVKQSYPELDDVVADLKAANDHLVEITKKSSEGQSNE